MTSGIRALSLALDEYEGRQSIQKLLNIQNNLAGASVMDLETRSEFVESWGSMGALWGINRSMARIHALLLATREPLGLEEITQELDMSRGNASMCLKDLRHWGVVRRVNLTGERRDFYIAEDDPWSMLFRIASERKKREFDPALSALQKVLATTGEEDDLVRERLEDLEELLRALDRLLQRFLANEGASRGMLKFLSAQIPYRKRRDEEGG